MKQHLVHLDQIDLRYDPPYGYVTNPENKNCDTTSCTYSKQCQSDTNVGAVHDQVETLCSLSQEI